MNNIEIINQVDEEIKELDTVYKLLEYACEFEKLNNVTFNVIIVDNDYIHELNRDYRDKDRETDVITFALEDDDSLILPNDLRVLGDIYISLDKCKEQAKEYGHSFLREICFLSIHGFYHLLGYDHMTKEDEEVMFKKQDEVLNSFGIKR